MQKIAILGAGRSAGYLIDYLSDKSIENDWQVRVFDQNFEGYFHAFGKNEHCEFITTNLSDFQVLQGIVTDSDLVVSVLPPSMHFNVARFCVLHQTHLVTASYISPEMKALHEVALDNNVILLNELGLDPGIDHLSAAKALHKIKELGGVITGFESYCGGLIREEDCTGNPWKYKFTWNPRNVVLAGQGSNSKWLQQSTLFQVKPLELFQHPVTLNVPSMGTYDAYPNRDSLSYIEQYQLQGVKTMLRGTLRRKGYCEAWQVLVQFGFTNDELGQDVKFENRQEWFKHLVKFDNVDTWLSEINVPHEVKEKIQYLELDNNQENVPENSSHASILLNLLESKWKLQDHDIDEVVMIHKIDYTLNDKNYCHYATLKVFGEGGAHTAMAKTVGLPLALGAQGILKGQILDRGCVMPFNTTWGAMILDQLRDLDVVFDETTLLLD
jgi:saccharopine dehydrogenase-like NADP-dependent oxidoreductase